MLPRFKMAASISIMELMSSGEKPITSMALCEGGGGGGGGGGGEGGLCCILMV